VVEASPVSIPCSTSTDCTERSVEPGQASSPRTESRAAWALAVSSTRSTSPVGLAKDTIVMTESIDEAHAKIPLYEPTNCKPTRPMLPLGFPSNRVSGRCFHYFIHRSSIDLTGPLQSQVWREYVLSVCATSPVIQHAVAALSGFHERYSFPENISSDEIYWREYYLAVKGTNVLVKAASKRERARRPAITNEILLACVIFTTIEILLGNNEAALRHLESGMALLQDYVTKSLSHAQNPRPEVNPATLLPINTKPSPRFDAFTTDLSAFFARLALQVHSFHPNRHNVARKTATPTSQPAQPLFQQLNLQLSVPSSLYRLIEHISHWIRRRATPYKYALIIPPPLHASQISLLAALQTWLTTYLEKRPEESNWRKICSTTPYEPAHLLLSYHLIYLKLLSALSPSESSYLTPISMRSFLQIICYSCVILKQRNEKMLPVYLPDGKQQKEFYFSLESSIVEALYFTALKCRHKVLRRCALGLLKCAGREGLWDGAVMAVVAEHVICVEEGVAHSDNTDVTTHANSNHDLNCNYSNNTSDINKLIASVRSPRTTLSNTEFVDFWQKGFALALDQDRVLADAADEAMHGEVHRDGLVHEVRVDIERKGRTVGIECGWFDEGKREWRYEDAVLVCGLEG